jgi:hypothetical protein
MSEAAKIKRAYESAAEISALTSELGISLKTPRGRPRIHAKAEPRVTPNEPHITVAIRKHTKHGHLVIFPKTDKRTSGPRLYSKVLKEILAALPGKPNAETKNAATRLAMLRCVTNSLNEQKLRGMNINTDVFLACITEEMNLSFKLGLLKDVGVAAQKSLPPSQT